MKTRWVWLLAAAVAVSLAGCIFPDRWEALIIPATGNVKDQRIAGKFPTYEQCRASALEAIKAEQPGARYECRKNCMVDPRNTTKVDCAEVKS